MPRTCRPGRGQAATGPRAHRVSAALGGGSREKAASPLPALGPRRLCAASGGGRRNKERPAPGAFACTQCAAPIRASAAQAPRGRGARGKPLRAPPPRLVCSVSPAPLEAGPRGGLRHYGPAVAAGSFQDGVGALVFGRPGDRYRPAASQRSAAPVIVVRGSFARPCGPSGAMRRVAAGRPSVRPFSPQRLLRAPVGRPRGPVRCGANPGSTGVWAAFAFTMAPSLAPLLRAVHGARQPPATTLCFSQG